MCMHVIVSTKRHTLAWCMCMHVIVSPKRRTLAWCMYMHVIVSPKRCTLAWCMCMHAIVSTKRRTLAWCMCMHVIVSCFKKKEGFRGGFGYLKDDIKKDCEVLVSSCSPFWQQDTHLLLMCFLTQTQKQQTDRHGPKPTELWIKHFPLSKFPISCFVVVSKADSTLTYLSMH